MGLFSEKLKTSITLYIGIFVIQISHVSYILSYTFSPDSLSKSKQPEWYQFQQLTESISIQPNGAKEAVESVRKRLKHGTTQQKINVLKVLRLLVENSNQQFHRELTSNEKLKERFGRIIESPSEDIRVRKLLMTLLSTWSVMFKDEKEMHHIRQMFERGKHYFRLKQPVACPDQQFQGTLFASKDADATVLQLDSGQYESKIMQEIEMAVTSANRLVYALQLMNNEQNDKESSLESIGQLYQQCKETKQMIVRYTHIVDEEALIGRLFDVNEKLLRALSMHDLTVTGQVTFDQHKQFILKESSNNQKTLIVHKELEDPFADPIL